MLTARDNFIYHEMLSHPALFSHPSPEHVVIIGGGDCGTLREVLKHDGVTRALQVEIDERVTRLAEEFFPELCASNSDPRAEFLFDDGIQWMKDADPGSVDVIIVDSTDPIGPAEGLFTEAFYRDCLPCTRRRRHPGAAERITAVSHGYHQADAQGHAGGRLQGPARRCSFRNPAIRPAGGAPPWPASRNSRDASGRQMRATSISRPAITTRPSTARH